MSAKGDMVPKIEFLANQANKVEGLAYSGFETFRGSPYTSCARETGQNSRDAPAPDISEPVRVSYKLLHVPRTEVPFADQLAHSIECCLADPQDEKTRQHLTRALQSISAPTLKVLEIADINTTGLTGPIDDPHSVFAALVKGDGVSNKNDAASAGSFGIGKNAAYAISDLQAVVYSTRWKSEGKPGLQFACQGRLRLISHADGQKKYSAEGYWGKSNFEPITQESDVPAWMRREARGTTILSLGFREETHWASRMTLSLVSNFFLAIDRKEIEFSVGDNKLINQSSLDSILGSADLHETADEADQIDELQRARRLLACVRSDATKRHRISIKGLGDFVLHLHVEEGLPRQVHILRNGIYITDNFAKFGQPLKQFRGTREFIAALEPAPGAAGQQPSRLLKQLENPAHDAFEPARIVDAGEQKLARKQIKELITCVREIIRETAKIEDLDHSQLEELSHLFASGGTKDADGPEDQEEDPERFRFGEARRGERAPPPGASGSGPGQRRSSGGKRGPSGRYGKGRRPKKAAGTQPAVPLQSIRTLRAASGDPKQRIVYFTPESTREIDIAVSASGLSSDTELRVAASSGGCIVNGRIRILVVAGKREKIALEFAEAFSGPVELAAVAVDTAGAT